MYRVFFFTLIAMLASLSVMAQSESVDFDAKMREYNLVDIKSLPGAEDIVVSLKYSTTDNFVGKDMYGSLNKAYFTPDFAKKIIRAQQILQKYHPDYTLLIYDAARPISVQKFMRSLVEGTTLQDFVADGTKGGRHNFGVAVDLTITPRVGEPLDMGATFDEFSDAVAVKGTSDTNDSANRNIDVYTNYVYGLVDKGLISVEAAKNRLLLIKVMLEAGLYPYRREWWHYEELTPMSETRKTRKLLDF